jgi:hypothetical protein
MALHSTRPNLTPTANSVCRSTSPFCLIHPEDVSVMYAETFKQLQYTTRLNTLDSGLRDSCLELSAVDTLTRCPHVRSSLCTSCEGASCSGFSAVVQDALWSVNNTYTSWLPPLSLCCVFLTKCSQALITQSVSPYSYSFCWGPRSYSRPLHLSSQRSFYGIPQSLSHFLIQKFIQMFMYDFSYNNNHVIYFILYYFISVSKYMCNSKIMIRFLP